MTRSEPWCQLRHYLSRWHSYRQAAELITTTPKRWPNLFRDYEILMLPSSEKMVKLITKSDLTAAMIVRNMAAAEKHSIPDLEEYAEDLQKLGLDKAIELQVSKAAFKPTVHAEIIVHDYLLKNGHTRSSSFWNDWQYIGSSKPTCRLCSYCFESQHHDGIQVRPSHFNLYPNWRLPDYPGEDDPGARKAYDEIFLRITQKIRDDAKRSLEQRTTRGKAHDSNTYSKTPSNLRRGSTSSASDAASVQCSTEGYIGSENEGAG